MEEVAPSERVATRLNVACESVAENMPGLNGNEACHLPGEICVSDIIPEVEPMVTRCAFVVVSAETLTTEPPVRIVGESVA